MSPLREDYRFSILCALAGGKEMTTHDIAQELKRVGKTTGTLAIYQTIGPMSESADGAPALMP